MTIPSDCSHNRNFFAKKREPPPPKKKKKKYSITKILTSLSVHSQDHGTNILFHQVKYVHELGNSAERDQDLISYYLNQSWSTDKIIYIHISQNPDIGYTSPMYIHAPNFSMDYEINVMTKPQGILNKTNDSLDELQHYGPYNKNIHITYSSNPKLTGTIIKLTYTPSHHLNQCRLMNLNSTDKTSRHLKKIKIKYIWRYRLQSDSHSV